MPLDRQIRVFISSTFRDMQAERDYLVKFTFPQLRKLCESRGVTWGEVDLRWGITDEEKAEGKVLPLCLEEIHRCRPYFIGLLGERYGWVPQSIPEELIEAQPWLAEHRERSVTELEIIHGVLREKEMHGHGFFYFRDPKYAETIPREKRADFAAESAENASKLQRLKQNIREAQQQEICKLREYYREPEQLGQWLFEDFTRLIDQLFPEGPHADPVERERLDHEAFARSRARVYVSREEYFDRLSAHAAGQGQPLVVLGESGIGKSALLANWFLRYRDQHPDDFTMIHFIGATRESADYVGLLRRIMLELKRHLPRDLSEDLPTQPEVLREEFPRWLARAAARSKLVLILDGLNQLEDRDAAPDLGWLPEILPPNCRLVLSTLPGRSLEAIRRRHWPEMQVDPLTKPERQELLKKFLEQFSRRLSPARVERLADAAQTANPLYLRAILNELRLFGIHAELDTRISYYLTAGTPEELYERILERWESDYDRDRQGLVRESLALLWAARRGLLETELLEILGKQGLPLPQAYWSPLFLALEESLVNRSGLMALSHDFLQRAVERRYLPNSETQRNVHLRLANYFSNQPLSLRRLDEQPWQDLHSEQWANLRNTLTDLPLFEAAWDNNRRHEWISYWTTLSGRYSPDSSYEAAVAKYIQRQGPTLELARIMQFVGWMLHDMGLFEASVPFKQRALAIREQELPPDDKDIAASLNDLAEYFRVQRRYSEARPLFERSLAMLESSVGANSPLLATALNNLAVLCLDEGDHKFALVLSKRALGIAETVLPVGDPQRITSLLNLAEIYRTLTDYGNARRYVEQALESSERFLGPGHPMVADCLEHMGTLYGSEANEEESGRCYGRALAIRRKIFGENHPSVATCLHNLAASANAQGKYDEAKDLYQRAFHILETVYGSDHVRLTECLSSLAANYQEQGKYADAIELAGRVLAIRERVLHAYSPDVAEIHNRLGELNAIIGHFDKALHYHEKAMEIREQLYGSEDISVAQSLNNLAELYRRLGQYDNALPLNQRALEIRTRVLGDHHLAVAESLNNIGVTYHQKGDQSAAQELCQRSLKIKEEHLGAEHPSVADTLNNLGQILEAEGDLANALPLHQRALEIRERCFGREHPSVGESLNNLGLLFNARGETQKALEHYQQALEIKEKIFGPDHPSVAGALNNLAVVNYQSGCPGPAAQLFQRSLSICEKILGPNHPETEQIRQNLHVCKSG